MTSPQTIELDGSLAGVAENWDPTHLNGNSPNIHLNGGSVEPSKDDAVRIDKDALREDILAHLEAIGLNGNNSEAPLDKQSIRNVHQLHRADAQERIRRALPHRLEQFLGEIANGDEVDPSNIRPQLEEARSEKPTGDLFRIATLLWSVPVSQGYGRRLRFLVRDLQNGKLIGLFALGDPVFNLRKRDEWIGWDQQGRRERLVNVMDAYVVGAMPPYADLLGGKLITSLISSQEVADTFRKRYGYSYGTQSKGIKHARLAVVTVTSALGRSSIYNRLKLMRPDSRMKDTPAVELVRLGTTMGYGHFQISDDLFYRLRAVVREDKHRYADNHQFGDGPNWRIRVARVGLESIGLDPANVLNHGIKRDVYAMPIAINAREYLLGDDSRPRFNHLWVDQIAALARSRWIVPRARRKSDYRHFRKDEIRSSLLGLESQAALL